jgi:predicted nucleic acid-binding protein
MTFVVDASVAAKWCLPAEDETFVSESLHLLSEFEAGRIRLSVPDLFWPEIGNIFWKAARRKRISYDDAARAIDSVCSLGMRSVPSGPLLKDAFRIAAQSDCTVYDCTYVALATISAWPLVTADERLKNSLDERFPIRWIGDFDRR